MLTFQAAGEEDRERVALVVEEEAVVREGRHSEADLRQVVAGEGVKALEGFGWC